MRILVSRTDRIGDVVLTLPLCGLLKSRLGADVIFLGRGYTRPVVEASPFVDEVLDWDEVEGASPEAQREWLRAARTDVILHVFPHPVIAWAARAARIPLRIGTSHRAYHWLTCNALEHFSRKRSPLHEAQLDVRLARRLLGAAVPSLEALVPYGRVEPQVSLPAEVAALLDPSRTTVVLHPKSRGSGCEWPLDRWRALVESVDASRVQLLVSGSAEEGALLRDWLATLPPGVVDITGRLTLAELIALFARVDGLVAAGTGPLHVAAAAGAHALGLFPPTPPIHPGRWAPLGPRAEFLTARAPCASCAAGNRDQCTCMLDIEVGAVRARIEAWAARAAPRA